MESMGSAGGLLVPAGQNFLAPKRSLGGIGGIDISNRLDSGKINRSYFPNSPQTETRHWVYLIQLRKLSGSQTTWIGQGVMSDSHIAAKPNFSLQMSTTKLPISYCCPTPPALSATRCDYSNDT